MVTDTPAPSRNDTTADRLRYELIRIQIEGLRLEQTRMNNKMDERDREINGRIDDQEKRLRVMEEVAVKFNFILYLTMGGGLIGLVNLIITFQKAAP